MNIENLVEAIGVWSIRVLLVVGAIACGLQGQEGATGALVAAFVLSVLFL